jgi:hypothetical protein
MLTSKEIYSGAQKMSANQYETQNFIRNVDENVLVILIPILPEMITFS